ncbi:MAG TPA: hypothetical protein VLK36_09630 [Gaiellaceae bacterium]|nr:hypothetical protein [Gaiellaceae bacterium]
MAGKSSRRTRYGIFGLITLAIVLAGCGSQAQLPAKLTAAHAKPPAKRYSSRAMKRCLSHKGWKIIPNTTKYQVGSRWVSYGDFYAQGHGEFLGIDFQSNAHDAQDDAERQRVVAKGPVQARGNIVITWNHTPPSALRASVYNCLRAQ